MSDSDHVMVGHSSSTTGDSSPVVVPMNGHRSEEYDGGVGGLASLTEDPACIVGIGTVFYCLSLTLDISFNSD